MRRENGSSGGVPGPPAAAPWGRAQAVTPSAWRARVPEALLAGDGLVGQLAGGDVEAHHEAGVGAQRAVDAWSASLSTKGIVALVSA